MPEALATARSRERGEGASAVIAVPSPENVFVAVIVTPSEEVAVSLRTPVQILTIPSESAAARAMPPNRCSIATMRVGAFVRLNDSANRGDSIVRISHRSASPLSQTINT